VLAMACVLAARGHSPSRGGRGLQQTFDLALALRRECLSPPLDDVPDSNLARPAAPITIPAAGDRHCGDTAIAVSSDAIGTSLLEWTEKLRPVLGEQRKSVDDKR
jgi:hypothetical protein